MEYDLDRVVAGVPARRSDAWRKDEHLLVQKAGRDARHHSIRRASEVNRSEAL